MAKTTIIYLLHLSRPFGHAKHYIGSSVNLEARLAKHGTYDGARMLYWAKQAGITWELVRTWPGGRLEEKRLKARGGAARHCPICRQAELNERGRVQVEAPAAGILRSCAPECSAELADRSTAATAIPMQAGAS